ncbi:hypothetical protein GCM10010387_12900 [Streptomyces inusitatus]|uniref:Uncharacterized protein n=1 Tax=Streptomyces inusitatus TaxID=68221 RepID=A0A918PU48_9ACTN|nr:DUF6153 family protein [Streptomyces inusitatus]GGZ21289.1 hypothetical protein GCM10010387_12900 [Streptomyces inusitatus]
MARAWRVRGTRRLWTPLLPLVLLFGLATMHTLGHPSPAAAAEQAPAHAQPHTQPQAPTVAEHPAADANHGSAAPGGHGTDPSLVCLAVLGVWGIALLGAVRAWQRRRARGAVRVRGLRPGPAPAPRAPPPRTLLTHLSVLRI